MLFWASQMPALSLLPLILILLLILILHLHRIPYSHPVISCELRTLGFSSADISILTMRIPENDEETGAGAG